MKILVKIINDLCKQIIKHKVQSSFINLHVSSRIFAYSSLTWMTGSADHSEKKGHARVI